DRQAAPPALLRILPTSSHPLLPPPPSSSCGSCFGADRCSHGVAERCTVCPSPPWLCVAHGPARLARVPVSVPGRVRLFHVLLGQRPSLHCLLRPSLAFVRLLRRYAAVRLPIAVHLGLTAHRLLPTVRVLPTTDSHGAGSRAWSFYAC